MSEPSKEALEAFMEIVKILQERYQLHDVPFGSKRIITLLDRFAAKARLDGAMEVWRGPISKQNEIIQRLQTELERLAAGEQAND